MSKSDTKAFWKALHKYSTNKQDNPDINLENCFEYLKKINSGQNGEGEGETDDIDINEVSNNPIYDEILNGVIADLEVYEAIQNLKNNKAPGTEKILN